MPAPVKDLQTGCGVPRGAPNRLALVALVVLSVGGCALWGSSRDDDPEPELMEEDVRVVVENRNFYDVTIYAHLNGERRRLGRVTGNTTEDFELDHRAAASLRFEVRLQAGPTFFTDRIAVVPGEEVRVQIPPHLDRVRIRR